MGNWPSMILSGLLLCGIGLGNQDQQAPNELTPHEEVIEETLVVLEQMTKTLTTVTDAATAKAAIPMLAQAAKKFKQVRMKAENLKQPDKKEKDRIAAKYQKQLATKVHKLRVEIRRVQALPGDAGAEVLKVLKEVLTPPKKKE